MKANVGDPFIGKIPKKFVDLASALPLDYDVEKTQLRGHWIMLDGGELWFEPVNHKILGTEFYIQFIWCIMLGPVVGKFVIGLKQYKDPDNGCGFIILKPPI